MVVQLAGGAGDAIVTFETAQPSRLRVIDTHTGGEPTRVVVDAELDLGGGSLEERQQRFERHFDHLRRAIVCEPRGGDVWVGAWLTPAADASSAAGVIFFNNVGYLGMCGHGTMGVAAALRYLGRAAEGEYHLDTPVGAVAVSLQSESRVLVHNVRSFRFRKNVAVALPDGRKYHGEIAWGGNWFFICHDHGLPVTAAAIPQLHRLASELRQQLKIQGMVGRGGAEIDHIELIGPPSDSAIADSRNFVLCPGGAYDRSPCGTGTSAKLACLAADGLLAEGQVWRQESIIGSVFEASFRRAADDEILPQLTGTAFVNADATLILDPADPFCMGISHEAER